MPSRCVKGSLADSKRVWNLKPDLFTYGAFINSLTKAGKLLRIHDKDLCQFSGEMDERSEERRVGKECLL